MNIAQNRTFSMILLLGILFSIPWGGGCAQTKEWFRSKSDDDFPEERLSFDEVVSNDGSSSKKKNLVAWGDQVSETDVEKEERIAKLIEKKADKKTVGDSPQVTLDEAKRVESQHQSQEEAERIYKQFLQQNDAGKNTEDMAYAYRKLAIVQAQREKYGASEVFFQKSLELSPNDPETIGSYAQSLRDQKKYSEVEAVIRDCIKTNRSDEKLQYLLGESLLHQKRYQEGFRYLKMSIGEPLAYQEMARIYYNHGDIAAANLAIKKHDNYFIARGLTPPQQTATAVAMTTPTPTSIPTLIPPISASSSEIVSHSVPSFDPNSPPPFPTTIQPPSPAAANTVSAQRQEIAPTLIATNNAPYVSSPAPKPANPLSQQSLPRNQEVPNVAVIVPTNPDVIVKIR